ncbi:hypothetical protein ILT44_17055 [Microvirga sp. BT689]|uniref:hypothetical protein n=1 Tax=Microvirga arvi TaxID=2778731 RepID=UPI00194EE923|nr:hypothetical protein [Microvirga arvi]MBM6581909.1 hypothetical protein [Microvirga arvi]
MPLKDLLLVIGKETGAGGLYALELARRSGAALTVTSSGAVPSLPASYGLDGRPRGLRPFVTQLSRL